ncbi:bifunctional phosphopantothenoylcysteine decarboxylase/phosphopantothenate--cysteine ligase CoaBC [candidate division WOR-3 bacterium]|uniref:Coenzyme A biosynthesis bifunctional protein CoaBC n=1 Tax=candidate division WOR-3 bacterium TaxID=2052148 RepID=A0A660SGP8_UNCW3|nr:MAG: bifunctional phosphopantothenoylcysteine decarboxylase/phosphopantothenate--cysteine ligase CoaBC [candidate division WOR-3 bacterium]
MEGKRVIVGVSSSIAIYRALELIRELRKRGVGVTVIMTKNATRLISPITFQALSGSRVHLETFDPNHTGISHIGLSEQADLFLLMPATANLIGKLAAGIGDDLLTTFALAYDGPRLIVPAMNDRMWKSAVVKRNQEVLTGYGYEFIGPVSGPLASGRIGIGHIAPTQLVLERTISILEGRKGLKGHRLLITGGRTEAPIDPVRVITNRASGRMALSLARKAIGRGGEVLLITGPVEIEIPEWIPTLQIRTWSDLKRELEQRIDQFDCLFMAIAVNDYHLDAATAKLKQPELQITLKRTPDIIKGLPKRRQFRVGFSLETGDHVELGKKKLEEKGVDIVVANTTEALGRDRTRAWLIEKSGVTDLGVIEKDELAHLLLDRYLSWSATS